jgi:hypothetical protein
MKVVFIKVTEFRQELSFNSQAGATHADTVFVFRITAGFVRFAPPAKHRMVIGAHYTHTDQESPGIDKSGSDDRHLRVSKGFEHGGEPARGHQEIAV